MVRHPDTPPGAIQLVEAELTRIERGATATFRAIGNVTRLIVPPPEPPIRKAGLWQTTCFELFVASQGEAYREFNFSPSGAWAAYAFDGHRSGMRDAPAEVIVETSLNSKGITLVATIMAEFDQAARVGLTAVIEEADGAIRYWATAFAPGEPDFHAAAVRSLLFDGVSAE
ncbi:MAG TPA: hypothetical protein VGD23_12180 [Sphingomicrobium sp.]